MKIHGFIAFLVLCAGVAGAGVTAAQDGSGNFALVLNKAVPDDAGGCALTFEVSNASGFDVETLDYLITLVGTDGVARGNLLLKFGWIGDGRTRFVEFNAAGHACDVIGTINVNDSMGCTRQDTGDDAQDLCRDFDTDTRAAIALR